MIVPPIFVVNLSQLEVGVHRCQIDTGHKIVQVFLPTVRHEIGSHSHAHTTVKLIKYCLSFLEPISITFCFSDQHLNCPHSKFSASQWLNWLAIDYHHHLLVVLISILLNEAIAKFDVYISYFETLDN